MACAALFTVSAPQARAEAPPEPPAKPKKPSKLKTLKTRCSDWLLGDRSTALDAALPGAVSGILAGTQSALLAGIASGQDPGEIIGRTSIGFIVGFGLGTLLGTLAGRAVKWVWPRFHLQPGIAALTGGAIIGSIVVMIVESFQWMPLGAAIGAASADLWLMLMNRMESATRLPLPAHSKRHFTDRPDETRKRRHSLQTNGQFAREADTLRKPRT